MGRKSKTPSLLAQLLRFDDLVLEIPLPRKSDGGHQDSCAHQQAQHHGKDDTPPACWQGGWVCKVGVVVSVPAFVWHEPNNDALQHGGRQHQAQAWHQHPAEGVVLPEGLHALYAHHAQKTGNGVQPAAQVEKPVQIEAMQSNRAAQQGKPGGQGLGFVGARWHVGNCTSHAMV